MGRTDTLGQIARRLLWWSSTPAGLASLFVVGTLIRLWLARGPGFPYDMSSFAGWAVRLVERGPSGFYPGPEEDFFVDYPPGYLYVLWGLGRLSRALTGLAAPPVFLLKLPAVLADLAAAALVVGLAGRLTPPSLQRRVPVRGLAAAAVLLNPAIFFISAVWGQVDSVLAALVLAGVFLLVTSEGSFGKETGGLVLLALAIATKPQGVFVLPVLGGILLWRWLRGPASEQGAWAAVGGVARVAGMGAIAAAAGFAFMVPFGLGHPLEAYRFFREAAGTYEVTSVFAFNLWGAVGFWRPDVGPEAVNLLGVPALVIGLSLFALGARWRTGSTKAGFSCSASWPWGVSRSRC